MALHTETTAVADFARGQQLAADRVATASTAVRSDTASLTPTFGLIGAEFLAALSYIIDNQAQRLDTAASRHQALSTTSADARAGYTATDDAARRGLQVRV